MSFSSKLNSKYNTDGMVAEIIRRDFSNVVDIQCTDRIGNVSIFNNEMYQTDMSMFTVNRGIVYNGYDRVVDGLPFCHDLSDTAVAATNTTVNLNGYHCFDCYEGTLLRVFNTDSRWFTATNRKLDAMKSRWASPKSETFGKRFTRSLRQITSLDESVSSIEDDYEFLSAFYDRYLDSSKTYMFLLRANETERIVCDVSHDETSASNGPILHICTVGVDRSYDFYDRINVNGHVIAKPVRHNFNSNAEIYEYIFEDEKCSPSHPTIQGVIAFHPDGKQAYKLFPCEYLEKFALRANVPSLAFRYLELRSENCPSRIDMFLDMYPQMKSVSDVIESDIYEICKELHAKYVSIYINGVRTHELKDVEKKALYDIHKRYLETRIRTTPSRINDILTFHLAPPTVNGLLKCHRQTKTISAAKQHDEINDDN